MPAALLPARNYTIQLAGSGHRPVASYRTLFARRPATRRPSARRGRLWRRSRRQRLTSAELYDPEDGTWTATGSLGAARQSSRAVLLPNGMVLVVGGLGSGRTAPSCRRRNCTIPRRGTWTPTENLSTQRVNHTATLLPNGQVLVAGGYMGFGGSTSSAELYVGPPAPPTLLNISTRMRVLTGENVLIAGFIITGTELKRVLIRGIGPSLNGAGLNLSDPTLELHQGSTTLATNDNWKVRLDATSQEEE